MKLFKNLTIIVSAISAILICMSGCKKDPVLSAKITVQDNMQNEFPSDRIPAAGGTLQLNYTIEINEITKNAASVPSAEIKSDKEWAEIVSSDERSVRISVAANESEESRTAKITFSYMDAKEDFTLTQVAKESVKEDISFEIEITEAKATRLFYSIHPSDETVTYVGLIAEKSYFDSFEDKEILMSDDYAFFVNQAEANGQTLEEYLGKILLKGTKKNLYMEGLTPETDYVIYCYGMTAAGEITSNMSYVETRTAPPYKGDITFDLELTSDKGIIKVDVTPSEDGVAYYASILSEEDYNLYGGSMPEAAKGEIDQIIADYLDWGYTLEEVYEYNSYFEKTDFDFQGLADHKYVAFACMWDESCEILGDVTYEWITTESVGASSNEITVSVSNPTATTVDVSTKTTNLDQYILLSFPAADFEGATADDDYFKILIDNFGWWGIVDFAFKGNVEGTFEYLEPGTDYYMFAFGYEAGVRTTDISKVPFTTLAGGDPEDCTFEVSISNLTSSKVDVSVHPSDNSIWYFWDIFDADETADGLRAYIDDLINDYYYGDIYEFLYSEIHQGDSEAQFSYLSPSTSYKIGCIALDYDTGEYLAEPRFSEPFTTEEAVLADCTIKAYCDRYFDGDALIEAFPGSYVNYAGCAMAEMMVDLTGDYDSFRYTLFTYEEGLEDPNVFSDTEMIRNLINQGIDWCPANFKVSYDTKMMVAAVAMDADGNYSQVYRNVFSLSRDGVTPPSALTSAVERQMQMISEKTGVRKERRQVERKHISMK